MKKVIIMDKIYLKTLYGGVLIVATVQDHVHHHYSIVFHVFDGEKDANWIWFFNMLKSIVPDGFEMVFLSDGNQSLIKFIGDVQSRTK